MSPFTKKPLNSRDSDANTAKTVPLVATSNVVKTKPTSVSAKKQIMSKLGELGIQKLNANAGSPVSGQTDDYSPMLTSTYESVENCQLPPNSVPSASFDASLNAAVPEWVLNFQKQFRAHELRFELQESRLHHLEALIQENLELKDTVAAQASLIAELQARLLAESSQDQFEEPMLVSGKTPLLSLPILLALLSNQLKWCKSSPP